jgi:hypothetical protein
VISSVILVACSAATAAFSVSASACRAGIPQAGDHLG